MSSFRTTSKDLQMSHRLDGIYRGIVEDIADPQCRGRARIRIFGIHTAQNYKIDREGVPTNELPWAEQVAPLNGGSGGAGTFSVPLRGTIVFLFFEKGDLLHPRYFGTLAGQTPKLSNSTVNSTGTSVYSDSSNSSTTVPDIYINNANEDENIAAAAEALGIEDDVCKIFAVSYVESGGSSGINADGTSVIKYEPHTMLKALGSEGTILAKSKPDICSSYPGDQSTIGSCGSQAQRYALLEEAKAVNYEHALGSCSWGKYQIMGYQYKDLGYGSIDEFVAAASDANRQEELFTRFIKYKKLESSLQTGDWYTFAKKYNGPANAAVYSSKIEAAYNQCSLAKSG